MTSLAEQLLTQSIRFFRTSYKDRAQILSHEIGTVLQSLVDDSTGPININIGGDSSVPPIPEIDSFDIPPFDFEFPEIINNTFIEIIDHRDDDDDDGVPDEDDADEREDLVTKTETTFLWVRSVVPGKITGKSKIGPDYYLVDAYPNGFLESESDGRFDPNITLPDEEQNPDGPYHKIYDVRQLDGNTGIPNNIWVLMFRIVELKVETKTTIDRKTQKITRKETDVEVVQEENLMTAGIPQNRLGKADSDIPALDPKTDIPGKGTVTFYQLNEAGTLVAMKDSNNVPITEVVYNSSSDKVRKDKVLQLKHISGVYFVDVEDCG